MLEAVLLAGDRGASRAIHGRSKAFVEVAGRPMVVHVLETLLRTPEIGEVFVVGDAIRLEKTLSEHGSVALAHSRGRALHIVPQGRTMFENVWQAFLQALPPGDPDPSHPILVVPSDIPLAVPQEISEFIVEALKTGADYAIGLTPEEAMERFAPRADRPGIRMAYFHLREGRFRQNNLHFVRPLRVQNRHYVQDMYEHRYQREWGHMLGLIGRLLRAEFRNLWVLGFYLAMHTAGVLNRRGHRRLADRVRRLVSLRTVERGLSALFRGRLVTVATQRGGAAVDVDNEADHRVADQMFERWYNEQTRLGAPPRA